MAKRATAYNTTGGPVFIDDEGRFIGGRERGDVDPSSLRVKAAIASGRLVLDEPATTKEG